MPFAVELDRFDLSTGEHRILDRNRSLTSRLLCCTWVRMVIHKKFWGDLYESSKMGAHSHFADGRRSLPNLYCDAHCEQHDCGEQPGMENPFSAKTRPHGFILLHLLRCAKLPHASESPQSLRA